MYTLHGLVGHLAHGTSNVTRGLENRGDPERRISFGSLSVLFLVTYFTLWAIAACLVCNAFFLQRCEGASRIPSKRAGLF